MALIPGHLDVSFSDEDRYLENTYSACLDPLGARNQGESDPQFGPPN